MYGPYRSSSAPLTVCSWNVTLWSRVVVWLKLRLFWTLAYRRQEWRNQCRYLEVLDVSPTGESKVSIRADNGSVVKNVYVNHGRPGLIEGILLDKYRKYGHTRMPRA